MRALNKDLVRAVGLAGGCVLLATLFFRLGPTRILLLLSSLGWNFLVVVALFATHELVRTLSISRWLPPDRCPRVRDLLRIRLFGEAAGALTRTGSMAAEPARAWLLANRGGQGVLGYSAAVGELMANSAMSAAVNIAVAGYLLLIGHLKGPLGVLAQVLFWGSLVYLSAIVVVVASHVRILGACARLLAALPFIGPRLRMDPLRVRATEQAISAALTVPPSSLARVLLLEASAQALLVCELFWAIRSMGVAVSIPSALVMEVMTRVLTTVEFVGATEMGFAVVFAWLGLPAAIGFTLSLTKTLRSLTAAGIASVLLAGSERSTPALVTVPQAGTAALDSGG
jgi:hypothetical protein